MPPAQHDGTLPLHRLRRMIERHLDERKLPGEFTTEDHLIVGRKRVARVDMLFVTPEDHERQEKANQERGNPAVRFGRFRVPPTMVMESLSRGHEDHDRETKRGWYAQFGVPHYWLLNGYERTLECLVLDGTAYRVDASGRDTDEVRPSLFAGLVLPLLKMWA
jgi:Uma2 family endonuclease